MAEFVLKQKVAERGLSERFEIASAATSREEIGNPVYPPARRMLAQHGIACDDKTARQMTRADYAHYDYIIAMDRNNLRNLQRLLGSDTDGKISLLMDYTGTPRDVADPWYTGDFQATWDDVQEGCDGLLRELLGGISKRRYRNSQTPVQEFANAGTGIRKRRCRHEPTPVQA